MRLMWTLAAVTAMAAVGASQAAAQMVRVGTFNKPSLVVAYYRSPMWNEVLTAKTTEMLQTKAAGDTKKAQELDAWGKGQQETAHQQLAGEAPIPNILDALSPALPDIARKAQVALIVADMPYANSLVQSVDVTDLILDWLKADEATRKIVSNLRSLKSPVPPLH